MNTFIWEKSSAILSCALIFTAVGVIIPGCTKKNSTAGNANPVYCNYTKAQLENISIFPADNPWHKDISSLQTDTFSSQIISRIATDLLHPDFGSGQWNGAPIGIPYVVVCSGQPLIPIVYRANSYDNNYGSESDPGPFPIPLNAPVEGNGKGDSHVIAVDYDNKKLYELYNASVNGDKWEASSGAIFNMQTNDARPDGWTSADAAGLPVFPGLLRYDEMAKGVIDHAIRFTLELNLIDPSYISPARHKVNGAGGMYGLPMGARLRLKNNFDTSSYSNNMRIILTAMKKYGLILADAGSNLFISGTPDDRWDNDELNQLKNLKGSDFEVIKFH